MSTAHGTLQDLLAHARATNTSLERLLLPSEDVATARKSESVRWAGLRVKPTRKSGGKRTK